MESKWKKYYSEIFRTYSSDIFSKLWGDYLDEYGEEYDEVYSHELEERKDEFAEFMYLFNKYNIDYDKKAIAMKILEMYEGLGDCRNPQGAEKIADMILHGIDRRIGYNSTWHPQGRPR